VMCRSAVTRFASRRLVPAGIDAGRGRPGRDKQQ
jgi:hypothetical protein